MQRPPGNQAADTLSLHPWRRHHRSPPPIPLGNRGVHPVFLRELLRQGLPMSAVAAGSAHAHAKAASLYDHGLGDGSISSSAPLAVTPRSSAIHAGPGGSWLPNGCTVAELLSRCIRPATLPAHMSLIQVRLPTPAVL